MKTTIKNLLGAVALIAFVSLGQGASAQLNVNLAGNVGIGTNASNSYKLYLLNTNSLYGSYFNSDYNTTSFTYGLRNSLGATGTGGRIGIYNTAYHNSTSGTSTTYGMYNYSNNYGTGTAYGLFNYLYGGTNTGARYGIYNYLYCGTNTGTKYALYSAVSCGGDYAGYFSGNVFISGTLSLASDAAKKENVQSLEGALAIVDKLSAKTYNYVDDPNLALPTESQFGFLAQDIEQVLPQLVKEVENPSAPVQSHEENDDAPGEGPQEYETVKSVNYVGLIPVLVKAMQEQQALIEEQSEMLKQQQAEIEELKTQVSKH